MPRFISGHNSAGQKLSAETRAKIAASRMGERNPMFGRTAVNAKPPVPANSCECGCGAMASPRRRFISGHNSRPWTDEERRERSRALRGAGSPHFIGRVVDKRGYIEIYMPEHPFAIGNYVPEHRLVVERHLRATDPGSDLLVEVAGVRYLRRDRLVHHENEIRDDNRIENLTPMTRSRHRSVHAARARAVRRARAGHSVA